MAGGDMDYNLASLNKPDSKGRTGFHRALLSGASLDSIQHFISLGAAYKMKDNGNEGALHFAVRGSSTQDVISFLLSLQLDINEPDELGERPLHKVLYTKNRDYLGMTKMLLDFGAELCAKDNYGDTLAHLFAIAQDKPLEDFERWAIGMMDNGLGYVISVRGFCGRTPLQSAMQNRDLDLDTIKLLFESSGMDINERDEDGATMLELALLSGRSLPIIKTLIELGANVHLKSKNGSGVLHGAVIGGNIEVIQYLISQGFDVNETNDFGDTPMHCVKETRQRKYFEVTKLLLDNGANLYWRNLKGNTLAHQLPLWKDVTCEDFKVWAGAIIENGYAEVFGICGEFGRTPLNYSLERLDLDLETMKLLIESAKLDINQPDDEGNTALHLALLFGRNLETVRNLVNLGADWKIRRVNGCSVLHSAVEESNKQAFLYFKSLGGDVNVKDEKGQTPLHYVRWTKDGEYLTMTKFLLENGADLNGKDVLGRTVDELMSDWLSEEEYNVWKEGMITLGHAPLFHE